MTETKLDHFHPASFRDPSGFLFIREGMLYRNINQTYRDYYDHLITSGLYEELKSRGDIIPHEEVSPELGVSRTVSA